MKDYQYHLINAGIAGALVTLGSISSVFTGSATPRDILYGLAVGLIAGLIIFLNKFNDWFTLQDNCKKKKKTHLFEFL